MKDDRGFDGVRRRGEPGGLFGFRTPNWMMMKDENVTQITCSSSPRIILFLIFLGGGKNLSKSAQSGLLLIYNLICKNTEPRNTEL